MARTLSDKNNQSEEPLEVKLNKYEWKDWVPLWGVMRNITDDSPYMVPRLINMKGLVGGAYIRANAIYHGSIPGIMAYLILKQYFE